MKVLHVTPSYYPAIQFGGPIQSVHLLNRALVAQGMLVDVITTNAGLENNHLSKEQMKVDGLKVNYFKYYGYVHYNFSPQLLWHLFRVVRNYDLVHITAVWNFPVLAAVIACKLRNVSYVISPRGTIYPETIALKSTVFKKIYYLIFARYCLNHAKAIHYTAQDEQEKVTASLKLKPRSWVIPNGIDTKTFENLKTIPHIGVLLPQLFNKSYLLFLGRISKKKGLDILISAFASLSYSYPSLYLVIAGPDEEKYSLELLKLIKSLGLKQKIIFTGILEGETKLAAYRDSKVFVLPSYSENFGMSVVEALACGAPVVISDQVGIYKDISNCKAGVVVHTTAESIVDGVSQVLESPELSTILSQNGIKMVVSHYDIRSVANAFIKEYQNV